jgi:hypothetical protein
MEKKNQFLFLYPVHAYFNQEVEMHAFGSFEEDDHERKLRRKWKRAKTSDRKQFLKEEIKDYRMDRFREIYRRILNECIDQRYRQKGFGMNFAIFAGQNGTGLIDLKAGDRTFEVDISFEQLMVLKKYADPNYVLGKVQSPGHLRIAGFHMWDCVEKVAKCAYENGVDVLVDEDLTEFLGRRIRFDKEFRTDIFPSYNPRKNEGRMFEMFMDARKDRPWLWQEY